MSESSDKSKLGKAENGLDEKITNPPQSKR